MEFNPQRPIYLQIADTLCARILSGEFPPDARVPSVREYGAELGVNPNTMVRVYGKLSGEGILVNRRGLGFFVALDAKDRILAQWRRAFLEEELPLIRRKMALLGIGERELLGDTRPD